MSTEKANLVKKQLLQKMQKFELKVVGKSLGKSNFTLYAKQRRNSVIQCHIFRAIGDLMKCTIECTINSQTPIKTANLFGQRFMPSAVPSL